MNPLGSLPGVYVARTPSSELTFATSANAEWSLLRSLPEGRFPVYLAAQIGATMVERSEVFVHHVLGNGFFERRLRPQTPLGKLSVRLIAASLLLFVAFFGFVAAGQRGGESFFSNLWLSVTMLPAAALAIGGGAVGCVAAIRDNERSLGALVAIILGSSVLLFVVGELVVPH